MRIFSVGHSSRSMEEFIRVLKAYDIELLVDVRSVPYSSRFSHFSRENLESALKGRGIEYIHLPELGGFKEGGYRRFMETERFKKGIGRLLKLAKRSRTAFMCAERDWRNCHRRFIASRLTEMGLEVIHIVDEVRSEVHPKSLYYISDESGG